MFSYDLKANNSFYNTFSNHCHWNTVLIVVNFKMPPVVSQRDVTLFNIQTYSGYVPYVVEFETGKYDS